MYREKQQFRLKKKTEERNEMKRKEKHSVFGVSPTSSSSSSLYCLINRSLRKPHITLKTPHWTVWFHLILFHLKPHTQNSSHRL